MALTAPPETQALLLDLQQFDTRLSQLDHRAKSLPELAELTQLGKQADEVRRTLNEQSGALDDVNAELKRTESDVEVVEARIKRDAERLQTSTSVKDVAGLEHEIAALQKRLNDLEEIELVVMERVEEHQAAVNQTRAEHEALQSRIRDVEASRDAALATIAAEREAAADDRRVLQTRVPERPARALREAACALRLGCIPAAGRRVERERREAQRERHGGRASRDAGDGAAVPGLERHPGAHRRVRHLMPRELVIEADGGSRGNPGQSGSGAVVIDPVSGEILAEIGLYGGVASNNVAEYKAMIAGVRRALEIDPDAVLHVRMDSKLVVEQMSGRWKIKHPDMADLAAEAREVLTGTPVSFEWIPREINTRADRLANLAMDRRADLDDR